MTLLTNFRQTLWKYCDAYIRRLANLSPPDLASAEFLHRALTSEKDFQKKTGKIDNPRRFQPVLDDVLNILETSFVHAPTLDAQALVAHINSNVLRGRANLHGIGELAVSDVLDCTLAVRKDRIPRLHAAIVGWPDLGREKEAVLALCQDLADRARLVWAAKAGVPTQPLRRGL